MYVYINHIYTFVHIHIYVHTHVHIDGCPYGVMVNAEL